LFYPIQQPTARTMAAMIGGRKFRLCSVFSLKHSRRMRHANKEHRVLMGISGGIVNSAPGMLLEHVVNVLHARDVPLANTIHALTKPADGRAKRDAVIANLPGTL